MRTPRIEYPGATFHVLARGNRKQDIFEDEGDRIRYLKLLGEHLEGRRIVLYSYCLMPNHVHLLVEQAGSYPVSGYMHRLQGAYATFFNHKHSRVGHLFQGRYKAILVDRNAYLLEMVRYIHLNPLRAGMEDHERYPWSSHRQMLGKDRCALARIRAGAVLRQFSAVKSVARRRYLEFLDAPDRARNWGMIREQRGGCILGDEDFKEDVFEMTGRPDTRPMELKCSIGALWRAILTREGLMQEPRGHRRSRLVAEVAYIAVEGAGMPQGKVAEHFEMEPTALTMAVRRLKERWQQGEGSRADLERWLKKVNCEA